MERPTIRAVDTDDDTLYILERDGLEPVVAHWPHPLLEMEPDAIRLPSIGSPVAWDRTARA